MLEKRRYLGSVATEAQSSAKPVMAIASKVTLVAEESRDNLPRTIISRTESYATACIYIRDTFSNSDIKLYDCMSPTCPDSINFGNVTNEPRDPYIGPLDDNPNDPKDNPPKKGRG